MRQPSTAAAAARAMLSSLRCRRVRVKVFAYVLMVFAVVPVAIRWWMTGRSIGDSAVKLERLSKVPGHYVNGPPSVKKTMSGKLVTATEQ